MTNCDRLVRQRSGHNGQPIGNHHRSSDSTIADPYDFPSRNPGVPNAPRRTNFAKRAATWRSAYARTYRQDFFCIQAMSPFVKLLWPLFFVLSLPSHHLL